MKTIKWHENLFKQGNNMFIASEIHPETIILLNDNKFFYVNYIITTSPQNIEDEDINSLPEDEVHDFIDENGNKLINIPGTAFVYVVDQVKGKHKQYKKG